MADGDVMHGPRTAPGRSGFVTAELEALVLGSEAGHEPSPVLIRSMWASDGTSLPRPGSRVLRVRERRNIVPGRRCDDRPIADAGPGRARR